MNRISLDTDLAKILARLNRSNSDALLNSIAEEFLRLHQAYNTIVARMHALELAQTVNDHVVSSVELTTFDPMPRKVAIDASFSLSAESGFYPLEYDNRGAPYRWTGPEPTFVFELYIDRKVPASLRMHYSKSRFKEARQAVRCYVDGDEIATTLLEIDGEFEIHGVLPTREFVGGTVVSFICPSVTAPASDGQSQDMRLLGLTFRWLRIDSTDLASPAQEGSPHSAVAESSKLKFASSGKSLRRI